MPTESNIVQEFAEGPTPDTVDAFGKVAEGPLIKYNPGGFAQFRAETTGLPPARAQFGDQEFWGQLVTPTTTKPTTEPPVKPPTEPPTQIPPDTVVVDEEPIFNTPNYTVDLPEQRIDIPIPEIRWDTSDIGYTGYDPKDDPDFLEGDLISADRNFTPYTTPVTDPAPLTPRTIQPKQDRPRISITPKGIPKPEKDLPPVKGTPKNTTGVFKPTLGDKAAQTLQDIFSATEKPARILFGKTRYDAEGPLRKDERQTFDTLKKFKDWSDGLTEEQFKLWETKGIPSETTGRAPVGPKYGKMLADFGRILKNEENIRTQEYGDLQLLAALNTAALISQYGAIGGAIPVLVTASDDIMSGMNNMFAKSPELAGNPIQDFVHGTTWVLGKTLQKTYNNTIGQVLPKIKDTRIKDKLGNIDEFMKAPRRPTMGTKAVISMPDPDGAITIPEPETPTERKQYPLPTEPKPFVREVETATAKPIRVSTPTPETEEIQTGDTPVSQTTSTRPEVETREALTVTPTTDTPTVEAPQGITIRDVGDITTEPPTRPEIETIGELRPTYSETARPITVAPITNVSTPQETFAENPQLTVPEPGIEQIDAKSITITPDGTIVEIPKGITIEEAEDIVRDIDPQEIETADLDLRYRQPVEAQTIDPIVVSPRGRTDEIEFAETPRLETPAIQPEVADPKSITIQGGTDEKTAPKGITVEDVKDIVSEDEQKTIDTLEPELRYKEPDESELVAIKDKIKQAQEQREKEKEARKKADEERKKLEKDKPFTIDVEEVIDERAKEDPIYKEAEPPKDLTFTPEQGIFKGDGEYYTSFVRVPVDEFGNTLDYNNPNDMDRLAGLEFRPINFFDLGSNNPNAGVEEALHNAKMDEIQQDLDQKLSDEQQQAQQDRLDQSLKILEDSFNKPLGANQVRGTDGQTYDINTTSNPNGWRNPLNPMSGLIDRNNPQTWSTFARWDSSIPQYIRDGLPRDHPQHEDQRPPTDQPLEGGLFGGESSGKQAQPISGWTAQANLQGSIQDTKPVYGPDGMFMGFESVDLYLEHESYPDPNTESGWGYRYRYVDPNSFSKPPWKNWVPNP